MNDWTWPGMGSPFCEICWSRASGCHLFGSFMTVPGLATSSGSLPGV